MSTPSPGKVTYSQKIVVGAGPAGLAIGACLKQEGNSCIILEEGNGELFKGNKFWSLVLVTPGRDRRRLMGAWGVSKPRGAKPGLYFCGYHVSPTGMPREIAMEAKRTAASIAHREIALL